MTAGGEPFNPAKLCYADLMNIASLFVTRLYRARLEDPTLLAAIEVGARQTAEDDASGQRWSEKNGYQGYTSYASLDDLAWRNPAFAALGKALDKHAAAFAKALDWDLGKKKLRLDSLWINVLAPGGVHTGHIHPLSVLSGTLYLCVPKGSGALKLEDPRLPLMMAAPPKKAKAAPEQQSFVYVKPEPGLILMWESWLRHEVCPNLAESERVSVSFNYSWG